MIEVEGIVHNKILLIDVIYFFLMVHGKKNYAQVDVLLLNWGHNIL